MFPTSLKISVYFLLPDIVSQNSLYTGEVMKSSQFLRGGGSGRGPICSQSLPANNFHPPWPFHIIF